MLSARPGGVGIGKILALMGAAAFLALEGGVGHGGGGGEARAQLEPVRLCRVEHQARRDRQIRQGRPHLGEPGDGAGKTRFGAERTNLGSHQLA